MQTSTSSLPGKAPSKPGGLSIRRPAPSWGLPSVFQAARKQSSTLERSLRLAVCGRATSIASGASGSGTRCCEASGRLGGVAAFAIGRRRSSLRTQAAAEEQAATSSSSVGEQQEQQAGDSSSTTTTTTSSSGRDKDEAYYDNLTDAQLKKISYERYTARRRRRIEERDAARLTEEERARRAKIGEANKGRTPWNKGRKHSPGVLCCCLSGVWGLGALRAAPVRLLDATPAAGTPAPTPQRHRRTPPAETIEKIRARTKAAMETPQVQKKIEAWLETRVGQSTPADIRDRIGQTVKERIQAQKVGGRRRVGGESNTCFEATPSP